jgi:hypothetical protein
MATKRIPEFRLDVLIKKEKEYFTAHCLQFDLVATDDTLEGVQKAIVDLCRAHIEYSIQNDNLDYLFSPAPKEVWAEYFVLAHNKSCDVKQENLSIPDKIFKIQEVICHV